MKKNILITGLPGCGKSTLMEKIVSRISEPIVGFLTLEIKERGRRAGFSIKTLDGREGILAHKNVKSGMRVGKYGVNISDIENIAVPSIVPSQEDEIIIIDEVGKMECLSQVFKETLIMVLDMPNWLIGSIAQKGDRFIQQIKEREDVMVININSENRDVIIDTILDFIKTD